MQLDLRRTHLLQLAQQLGVGGQQPAVSGEGGASEGRGDGQAAARQFRIDTGWEWLLCSSVVNNKTSQAVMYLLWRLYHTNATARVIHRRLAVYNASCYESQDGQPTRVHT